LTPALTAVVAAPPGFYYIFLVSGDAYSIGKWIQASDEGRPLALQHTPGGVVKYYTLFDHD
jgi:hypothetical protein